MRSDDDRDRSGHVHRALRELPCPRAPRTLLPRVLASVARPWYAREWLAWPHRWQAASVALAAALVTGTWLFLETSSFVGPIESAASTAAGGARVLWRFVFQPVAAHVLTLGVAACLTCAAGWAALSRLASPGVSQ